MKMVVVTIDGDGRKRREGGKERAIDLKMVVVAGAGGGNKVMAA